LLKELKEQKHVDVYLGAAEFIKFPKTQPYDWFEIQHFAGSVRYYFENFILKNKDKLFPHLVDLINGSEIAFTSELMTSGGGGKKKKKPEVPTIASKFVKQLKQLCDTMEKTVPHYVRCVKPNSLKLSFLSSITAGSFEANKAMRQLRYAGVMETVAIRRAGYPVREEFADFWNRCKVMGWNVLAGIGDGTGDACADGAAVLKAAIGGSDETGLWVIGKTKIFGKETLLKDVAKWQQAAVVGILQLFAKAKMARLEQFLPWRAALMQRRAEKMAVDLVKIQAGLRSALAVTKLAKARVFRENYALIINEIGDTCVAISKQAFIDVDKLCREAQEEADLAQANEAAIKMNKAADEALAMCQEAFKVVDRLVTLAAEKTAQAKYEADNAERIFLEKKGAKINSGCRRHLQRLIFHDAIAKAVKIQHKRRRLRAKRAVTMMRVGAAGLQSLVRGAIQRKEANIKKRAAAKVSSFLLDVSIGRALEIWVKEMSKACSEGNDVMIQRLLLRSDPQYSMIRSMKVDEAVTVRDRKSGKTFFHTAAVNGKVDTLGVLSSAGSAVATKDLLGRTPLYEACSAGDAKLDVAKFIYRQARKEPEDQSWMIQNSTSESKTCLDAALEALDGERTVEWLTQLGAFNSSDAVGMTAAELGAEIERRRDEAKLMESKMDARREARRAKRQAEAQGHLQQSLAASQAAAAPPVTHTVRSLGSLSVAQPPPQQIAQSPYSGGAPVQAPYGGGAPIAAPRFQAPGAPAAVTQSGYTQPGYAPAAVQPGYAPAAVQSGYAPAAALSGYAPTASQPGSASAAPVDSATVGAQPGYTPVATQPGYAPASAAPGATSAGATHGVAPTGVELPPGVGAPAAQAAGAAAGGSAAQQTASFAAGAPVAAGGYGSGPKTLARDAANQLMSMLLQAAGGSRVGAPGAAASSTGATAPFDPVVAGRSRYAMPTPGSPYAAPTQWSPSATASAPAPAPAAQAGAPPPPATPTLVAPSEWREVRSSSGLRYYYNVRTRESSWEAPAAFDVHTPNMPSLASPSFAGGAGPRTPAPARTSAPSPSYTSTPTALTSASKSGSATPITRVEGRSPDVALWSIATVGSWLLELNLGEHLVAFRDAAVDGDMLLDLTDVDLQSIGVAHPMHRKKVLKRVERLRGSGVRQLALVSPSKVSVNSDGDEETKASTAASGGSGDNASVRTWLQRALLTMSTASDEAPMRGWSYIDESGRTQGEFTSEAMKTWYAKGHLRPELQIRFGGGAWVTLGELYPEGCGNAFELDSRRDLEQAREALTGVLGSM